MKSAVSSDPRYPVGKFSYAPAQNAAERNRRIEVLAKLPAQVRGAVAGLSEQQLEMPYRAEGWTVRQVVHHIADSHMNAYVRTKLALTETEPTIKPYDEAAWAKLADSKEPV
ncbi:MAG: maleylpyruvate isomerase N-terminal domain-containing protein, partial [Acidobacteriales bacterium]|nr:maleylpyruvate isomerase N-terminal domain-containing protein [Terriglobales bacterium]